MVIKLRLDPDKILLDIYSVFFFFQEFDISTDNKNLRNVS